MIDMKKAEVGDTVVFRDGQQRQVVNVCLLHNAEGDYTELGGYVTLPIGADADDIVEVIPKEDDEE